MLSLLLVTSTLIVQCFCGQVAQLGYEAKSGFNQYRFGTKDNGKVPILTTQGRHTFSLAIDYRRYRHFSSGSFLQASVVDSTDHQNIVMVYYDRYLLETFKVPKIDSKYCTLDCIDQSIKQSVHPRVPDAESDNPYELTVFYSFTNDVCVRGIYGFFNSNGKYYEKLYKDSVVDGTNCK